MTRRARRHQFVASCAECGGPGAVSRGLQSGELTLFRGRLLCGACLREAE